MASGSERPRSVFGGCRRVDEAQEADVGTEVLRGRGPQLEAPEAGLRLITADRHFARGHRGLPEIASEGGRVPEDHQFGGRDSPGRPAATPPVGRYAARREDDAGPRSRRKGADRGRGAAVAGRLSETTLPSPPPDRHLGPAHRDAKGRDSVAPLVADRFPEPNRDGGYDEDRGGNRACDSAKQAGAHDTAGVGDELPQAPA